MKGRTAVATDATSGVGEAAVLGLASMGARILAGTGVTANCLRPGFVATRFGRSSGDWTGRLMPLVQTLAIPPERGADTIDASEALAGSWD